MPKSRAPRAPKAPKPNPIQLAIHTWIDSISAPEGEDQSKWKTELLSSAPKRFTIYEPMALLPSGSFTTNVWTTALSNASHESTALLWSLVLKELSIQAKEPLTHLAANEGIPLRKDGADDENVLRSPSGLRILHGDFGPADVAAQGGPNDDDFGKALWVSTKQNGILQTWAPRWTMFSRGNVKEKARLLDMGDRTLGTETDKGGCWAVDLYAGIGYFVFSYARLGMRVLCWEINPWSVEGLRRGAEANRWTVRVVQGADLLLPTADVVVAGDEQIVVFLESNEEALGRVRSLQAQGTARDVRHVNCGFLPTSEPVWKSAWDMCATTSAEEAWLHLHENVGVNDTETRRAEIQRRFENWANNDDDAQDRAVEVEHVELVKTFAPGVWHCVFDARVYKV